MLRNTQFAWINKIMYKLQSKLVKTYDAVIKIIETIEFTSIDKSIRLLRWKTFCFCQCPFVVGVLRFFTNLKSSLKGGNWLTSGWLASWTILTILHNCLCSSRGFQRMEKVSWSLHNKYQSQWWLEQSCLCHKHFQRHAAQKVSTVEWPAYTILNSTPNSNKVFCEQSPGRKNFGRLAEKCAAAVWCLPDWISQSDISPCSGNWHSYFFFFLSWFFPPVTLNPNQENTLLIMSLIRPNTICHSIR